MKKKVMFLVFLSIFFILNSVFMYSSGIQYVHAEDTIKIYTVDDLYAINNNMSGNYILMNDLDLSEATASGGTWDYIGNGWNPIGSNNIYGSTEFTGTFNGNGYTIRGMRIAVSSLPSGVGNNIYIGLFANNAGTINNLRIEESQINSSINGYNIYCGGFAAYNSGSIINCHSYAKYDISCKNRDNKDKRNNTSYNKSSYKSYVGGISGYSSGTIKESSNNNSLDFSVYGTVEYSSMAGGFVASSTACVGGITGFSSGLISKSYNLGNIIGNASAESFSIYSSNDSSAVSFAYVGGITGEKKGDSICDCYTCGNISFTKDQADKYFKLLAGGFIGDNTAASEITRCYSTGDIDNQNGGVIWGRNYKGVDSSDIFYVAGTAQSQIGATALNESQFSIKTCFPPFDFDNTWVIDLESECVYPQLKSNRQDNKDIELVEWKTEPTKKDYYVDDSIDCSGGKIKVYYKNGSTKAIDITKGMLTGYDMSQNGIQEVTVDYRGYELKYNINVSVRPEIASLSLYSEPDKKEFVKGTNFDFTGCKAKIVYVNDTTEYIDINEDMTTGGNINQLGNQTIRFSMVDKYVEFNVKVVPVEMIAIEVSALPTKTSFIEGVSVDLSGLEVVAKYNNGTQKIITDYELGQIPVSVGKHNISVTYEELSTSFEIEISAKKLTSLKVKTNPNKVSYVLGQKFDPTGMVIEATYDNGETETITEYTYGNLPQSEGYGKVTISYLDKEAYVSVVMSAKEVQKINILSLPKKIDYIEGETFDPTGLIVSAEYDYGDSGEIEDYIITGFGLNTEENIITISFGGKTASFSVYIHQPEEKIIKPATCTENGSKMTKCINCGKELSKPSIIVAHGHKWDNGVITKQPTATDSGIKTYTCTVCKTTKTTIIPATGNQSSETPQPTPTQDKQQTPKEKTKVIDGIGTISADGKFLTDTNGVKYYVSAKVKARDLKNNLKVADKKSGGKYKITKVTKKKGKVTGGTVTYMAPYNKNCTKATAGNYIKIGGVKFKITAVNANAFKGCVKLKSFTVGENITTIGKNAFKDCKNLKTFTIKSLSLKSIGANSFKGVNAKIRFKVPKKKLDRYERMIRKAGAPKSSKITK